jgi:hypothetical protein
VLVIVSPQILVQSGEQADRDHLSFVQAAASEGQSDYRTTVAFAIQRSLDHFQIEASAEWKRYLLVAAILLSMVLFTLGLRVFGAGAFIPRYPSWHDNFLSLLIGTTLVGLCGGFLASIARDVVAVIEKLRR